MSIHGLQRIPENEEFLQFYTVFENVELRDPKLGFSGVPTLIFLSFSHFWGQKRTPPKWRTQLLFVNSGVTRI